MYKIVKKEKMADGTIYADEIKAISIANKAKPGQFVILKANETGERIPLTISDVNKSKGTITIIYMILGKSTALFRDLQIGNGYQDVIGPLGKPTNIKKVGNIICIGGGTGIAVLHPITREMKKVGNDVTCIIGARNKNLLILEEKMKQASNDLIVCTDDGSYGYHGFVTEVLSNLLKKSKFDLVLAIGPVPMMKACSDITKNYKTKILVSLNPIMIDGTGMCGCCRVSINGKTKFVCVDGPEFDGHLVDYTELTNRLKAYKEYEGKCYKNYLKN